MQRDEYSNYQKGSSSAALTVASSITPPPLLNLMYCFKSSQVPNLISHTEVVLLCPQLLIAESFGGRDEPVDTLVGNFVDVGLDPVFAPLRVKAIPTESTYQAFEEAGTDLAQLLTAKVCTAGN